MNELEVQKDLINKACSFLEKIVIPPLEEIGGLLADQVKYWRLKNQVKIIIKAEDFLIQKKISPKKIPLKTLASLLEYSSWEENTNMRKKWSALLANYANSKLSNDINLCYVEILNQLTSMEVKILDILYDAYYDRDINPKNPPIFSRDKIFSSIGLNIEKEKQTILIDNLFRLNLLQSMASHSKVTLGNFPVVLRTYDAIEFTPLGIDFVKNCRIT